MQENYKIKISMIKLNIFFLLLCVYFRSLIQVAIGNSYNILLAILMLTLWLCILTKSNLKMLRRTDLGCFGLWFIFMLMILFHKYPDSPLLPYTTLVTGGSIITAYFLLISKKDWIQYVWNYSGVFVKVHCIATLLFGFIPKLYKSTIYNLYQGTIKRELTSQIANNCVPGLTNHYSTNGIYLAIGLMMFGDILLFKYKEKRTYKTKVWLILIIVALLITGKRAHLLFSLFSIVVMWLLCSPEKNGNKLIKGVAASLAGLIILSIFVTVLPSMSVTISRIAAAFDGGDITNGRLYFYQFALEWFKEKPIFGIGWEGFKYRLNSEQGAYVGFISYMSAHNVYLQVLCEFGIVGLIGFVTKLIQDVLVYVFRIPWKNYGINDSERIIMGYAVAMSIFFILYCFTGNPLYDIEIFLPYMLAMTGLYCEIKK